MIKQKIVLSDYFTALERLRKGLPKRVPKDSPINNDTVALEAGRKKGSIKKSRSIFTPLIMAIKTAAADQTAPDRRHKAQLDRLTVNAMRTQEAYEQALMRELSLRHLIDRLEKQMNEKSTKLQHLHRKY